MTLTQPVSSEKSPQSFSESHLNVAGMHRPDLHMNSDALHVVSESDETYLRKLIITLITDLRQKTDIIKTAMITRSR